MRSLGVGTKSMIMPMTRITGLADSATGLAGSVTGLAASVTVRVGMLMAHPITATMQKKVAAIARMMMTMMMNEMKKWMTRKKEMLLTSYLNLK